MHRVDLHEGVPASNKKPEPTNHLDKRRLKLEFDHIIELSSVQHCLLSDMLAHDFPSVGKIVQKLDTTSVRLGAHHLESLKGGRIGQRWHATISAAHCKDVVAWPLAFHRLARGVLSAYTKASNCRGWRIN